MDNRQIWDQIWSSNPQYGSIPPQLFERLIEESPGNSALELGMGTGELAVALAQRGFSVTGVDYSEHAIGKAKQLVAEAKLENSIAIRQEDIAEFEFPNAACSMIVVSNVINFLSLDTARRLTLQMQDALEPGGLVYVSAISEEDYRYDACRNGAENSGNLLCSPEHSCFFTEKSLQACFPGLKTLVCESDRQQTRLEGKAVTLCSIDHIDRRT